MTTDVSYEEALTRALDEQDDRDAREARPVCQFCLADSRYTRIGADDSRRCPVCGADYSGPRRSEEFALIRETGLLWDPPRPSEGALA